jgi:hypothetical protein
MSEITMTPALMLSAVLSRAIIVFRPRDVRGVPQAKTRRYLRFNQS